MERLQLGEASIVREDDTGLYFEGTPFATSEVIDQLTVMNGRASTGASMLFEFGEIEEDDAGVEHILSFTQIYEVGPTPEGANPLAYAQLIDREDDQAEDDQTESLPMAASIPNYAALAAAIHRATKNLRRI